MNMLWFLVVIVLVAILISILWNIFNVGELFAGRTRTQRLLIALLGLLIIIGVVWWAFGRFAPGVVPF